MVKHEINAKWLDNMAFEAEINGHKIITDANKESGGDDRGPSPKRLMLVALAGCTGIDVVSILKKMRVEIDYFNVKVVGDVTDEQPMHYDKMHIVYEFRGKDLPMEKLEKAVSLSEERYCGVSAVYKKAMEITSEIKILD